MMEPRLFKKIKIFEDEYIVKNVFIAKKITAINPKIQMINLLSDEIPSMMLVKKFYT